MAIYIKGLGCISPLIDDDLKKMALSIPFSEKEYHCCNEPDYKTYINPMTLRRMSRVVKMGIHAASVCLSDAVISMPDAIVTGTGLGCIEDTEKFLITMIRNDEKFLTPTPFIQSTHNTVSSQISLFLKCHAYNVTYSHRGASFESALIDGISLINEGEAKNVLLGGIDEITDNSFYIQKRLGMWKNEAVNDGDILNSSSKGSIAGEGAAFFMLTNQASTENYAEIKAVKVWENASDKNDMNAIVSSFLKENNVESIDVLMLGLSGNKKTDGVFYKLMENSLFVNSASVYFKHLCGDYQTASSFAVALGASIIKNQIVPDVIKVNSKNPSKVNNILIYNHFQDINHSLILLCNDKI